MIVGAPKETFPGERRVAIIPAVAPLYAKMGLEVAVEAGAGAEAGFPDAAYADKGAQVLGSRDELFGKADLVLQVRGYGANQEAGKADLARLRKGQTVAAILDPLGSPQALQEMAQRGVSIFAMEMVPRITRAQSMDVLSSMATLAGYKAVLLGAESLVKIFPMLMTAAGTVAPARVLVIGAGVAGLQAIATAKRLGAVVHAYDLRPEVKEQIESLGGTFVELPLETADAQDAGGYAKAQSEEFLRKQQELLAKTVAESDVVITTAQVPGRKAPRIVTAEMVRGMVPGSVIVDIAAEQGGNCELTQAGQTVQEHGVTILGPVNLPASIPNHGSQLYSRNLSTFFQSMVKEGQLTFNMEDEVVAGTLVAREGEIVHPRIRELLGLGAPERSE